jgi:hypothetical protein
VFLPLLQERFPYSPGSILGGALYRDFTSSDILLSCSACLYWMISFKPDISTSMIKFLLLVLDGISVKPIPRMRPIPSGVLLLAMMVSKMTPFLPKPMSTSIMPLFGQGDVRSNRYRCHVKVECLPRLEHSYLFGLGIED